MADHEALKAQAEAAYALGAPYLTHAEGWQLIDETDGVKSSLLRTDVEHVAKLEGDLNKSPQFAIKFIAGNLAQLRATHSKNVVATEYVKSFEDRSHVIKEVSTFPVIGEQAVYKYYSTKLGEDGSVTILATTAKLPEYPPAAIDAKFFILQVTPTPEGSHFVIVLQSTTAHPVDDATKLQVAHDVINFYVAIVNDIRAAPSE